MKIEQLVPSGPPVEVDAMLEALNAARITTVTPFSEKAVAFCDALARSILRHPVARGHPALVALAYWMRRASIRGLAREFNELETSDTMLVPRGLVFHVPPTNVDTMFVYSLVVSLLVGNRNVVRVSRTRSEQMDLLCVILEEQISEPEFADIAATTRIISYGHEPEVSMPLSLAADVRVIWGGDGTVNAIRSLAAKPASKDVAFADRYSLAAIDTRAYLAASDEHREGLAHEMYNDAYWFDQMACSSPRLVVWTGDAQNVDLASNDMWARVQAQIEAHAYQLPTGVVTSKLGFVYGAAIDHKLTAVRSWSNELTVMRLADLSDFSRRHPGAGTFFEATAPSLVGLADFVVRKDQTLTIFGQDADAVRAFVRATNGRGIDRVVPAGQALIFGRFWDGYDLLQELTRRVAAPMLLPVAGRVA